MVLKMFYSRFSPSLMVTSTLFASSGSKDDKEKKDEALVRARDLSIYSTASKKTNEKEKEKEVESESILLGVVREMRQGLSAVTDQLSQVTNKVNHVVDTGKAHMSSSIQILREDENNMQRYGAIAIGGLIGHLLALRRGWFRRITYTATGATAVAAICYPDEAKEYSSEAFQQTKRYAVIAYHFINGVLRDYVGVQLPSLQGPLSIGSSNAVEKDASTVPTSAALMPPPASTPSHISSGPIPLPPIDFPSSVSDPQKNQG